MNNYIKDDIRQIYIYSDESGTFDYIHNAYFLFAGVICFSKKEKEVLARKYSHAEKCIRGNIKGELKANKISNEKKGKLFRSLNQAYKFCVLIKQRNLNKQIFENKRHKQRYLDYAYKIVIRKCLDTLIKERYIKPRKVEFIIVHADERSTCTDSLYELKESLLSEFKNGSFNKKWEKLHPPIFPSLIDINVRYCNSKKVYLIRAADIICNHCYHSSNINNGDLDKENNMFIYYLPGNYIGHDGLEYFQDEALIVS